MAEQNLHGSQVAGLLVDDRRLGPPKRVRPVILPAQSNSGDPFIDEPRVLPSADVLGVVGPAREGAPGGSATIAWPLAQRLIDVENSGDCHVS